MSKPDDERGSPSSEQPYLDTPHSPYGPQRVTLNPSAAPSGVDDDLTTAGTIAYEARWIGPLPPPSLLAEYGSVVPDGAARIFRQFEEEAAHRRQMEKTDVVTRRFDLIGGQLLVAIFIVGAFLLTAYAIARGALWVAGIIGSLTTVLTIYFSAHFRKKSQDQASSNSDADSD